MTDMDAASGDASPLRKPQENAPLQESDAWLRDVMFTMVDWVWEVDATGAYTYISQKGLDFLGLPREAVIGSTPFDYMAPDEARRIAGVFAEITAAKAPITDLENWVLAKNGEIRCMLTNGVPVLDKAGNLKGYRGVDKDITVRKQAEAALRESEQNYKTLMDSGQALVWVAETDKRCTYFNRVWLEFTGRTLAQETGEGWVEGVHPEDLKRCIEVYVQAFDRRERFSMEYRLRRHDGEYRWLQDDGCPRYDSRGEFLGYIGHCLDITSRKQAELYNAMGQEILRILNESDDLHGSVQRILAAVKAGTESDAVGLRLQDGEDFPYFSQEGFSRDFLRKENLLAARDTDGGVCRDKDGRVSLECACGLVLSGKTDPANPFFTPGGSCWTNDSFPLLDIPLGQDPRLHPRNECIHQGYASIVLVPIRAKGRIVGLLQLNDRRKGRFTREAVEALETITQNFGEAMLRKQAEAEKATLEAQLQQAKKMESVGRLAGGVAHDFNNMLGVIIGHTEFAMDQVTPGQALHADLEEIRKAAKRSADLTRQLLAFARKQTIAPKVLDLNATVDGMLTMLKRLISEDVELVWQPGAGLWPVRVDPSQVDQILANLCINARDAISGGGKVVIKTENTVFNRTACAGKPGLVPGEYVGLTVSDDGCGMDEETLSHIFEPFFTTKKAGEGTGLGLATVYGIVKQNNGWIDVSSEPDQGATFTIYLPRHMSPELASPPDVSPKPAELAHETILLVEDDRALLSLTGRMLELQGYTVLAANSPGESLRLAREHAGKINLLLTDVIMPEMNGLDLATKLREFDPYLKCLFMSGYPADVLAPHGVLDDDLRLIQKPFSRNELFEKIQEIMNAGNR